MSREASHRIASGANSRDGNGWGEDHLIRRQFFGALATSVAAPSLPVLAQQPGRTYRFGFVTPQPRTTYQYVGMIEGLARLGFVEGRNLQVDDKGFGLKPDQFAAHTRELVAANVDLIFAGTGAPTTIVREITKSVPVLAIADDMVGEGIVQSMARPGGNITGVSLLAAELDGKRQEILIDLLPGIQRLAVLADAQFATAKSLEALEAAGRARGVAVSIHKVANAADIGPAIDAAQASGAQGLNVMAAVQFFINRKVIFERTATHRLPAIYQWPEYVNEGAFAAYGPRFAKLYREEMATMAAAMFNGTKPADLPVRQPINFELTINLKTAKALGVTVPRELLVRADEVVE
jgi:putative tryptophan/tyrosine transport system substrate-binding protein